MSERKSVRGEERERDRFFGDTVSFHHIGDAAKFPKVEELIFGVQKIRLKNSER